MAHRITTSARKLLFSSRQILAPNSVKLLPKSQFQSLQFQAQKGPFASLIRPPISYFSTSNHVFASSNDGKDDGDDNEKKDDKDAGYESDQSDKSLEEKLMGSDQQPRNTMLIQQKGKYSNLIWQRFQF